MAHLQANGVRLHYELTGEGPALALVHGSWVDADNWAPVVPALADEFKVLTYDRRGHSRSERPASQGSVHEDAEDLAALLEALGLAPAHVVGNSYGAVVALRLLARRPDLFRSLSCHEPPAWAVLADDPEARPMIEQARASLAAVAARIAAGDDEGGARQFVEEIAFGPGAWENALPPEVRETFVFNAPTFLDESRDPDQLAIDRGGLEGVHVRVQLTEGTESPPLFPLVLDQLAGVMPYARRETVQGAGHVPQLTHPEPYAEALVDFARAADRAVS